MSSAPAGYCSSSDDEMGPMSLYDNPDIEFLPPNIPVEDLAACLRNEQEPIAKRCVLSAAKPLVVVQDSL